MVFALSSLWGKFGGLYACGATIAYIVALPKSSVKSIAFRSKIEKEGLPRSGAPDLETSAQGPVGKRTRLPGEQTITLRRGPTAPDAGALSSNILLRF